MRPCTIVGNVGAAPELRYTPKGSSVTSLNLALYAGKDEETGKALTTWVRATCWGDLAEIVCKRVMKGDKIQVEGYLQRPRTYHKKDGKGGLVFDEEGFPVSEASLEVTAFAVKALDYVAVKLSETEDGEPALKVE